MASLSNSIMLAVMQSLLQPDQDKSLRDGPAGGNALSPAEHQPESYCSMNREGSTFQAKELRDEIDACVHETPGQPACDAGAKENGKDPFGKESHQASANIPPFVPCD